MPTLFFDRSHWKDADEALRREWLITNGLGGWASGTVGGANTRRYHGALVAALRPPVDRRVLVSKLDDWAAVNGARYGLTANEFASGAIDPQGWHYLDRFELKDGLPHWHFKLGPVGPTVGAGLRPAPTDEYVRLKKSVFMPHGHNAAWTVYHYHYGNGPLTLTITPLLNQRDYHSQTQAADWKPTFEPVEAGMCVRLFPGAHPLWMLYPGGRFEPGPVWVNDILYRVEKERGLPETESVLKIGTVTATLTPGDTFAVLVSAEAPAPQAYNWRAARQSEAARALNAVSRSRLPADSPDWVRQLVLAADQFVVLRGDSGSPPGTEWRGAEPVRESNRTIIAGYHWFSDWGRDTMIALPGLCLSTGRFAEAASILRTFARHISEGMLPNRFPDSGDQPEYNTVDATLWYFHAVDRYAEATGDWALARELFPALEGIVDWHVRGTRYNIHCDDDGLLFAGAPGVQLTWMDAKVGDWVVTPRIGKPVEINALWINALRVMARLSGRFGGGRDYGAMADKAAQGFARYWNAERGCLFDVIDDPNIGSDPALRPNQLLAVSLPHGPIDPADERARAIVDVCERELLTPVGVRSLAPGEAGYRPHFGGGPLARDGAYHQGTVWGWLIGPFVEAHYKVHGDREAARRFLEPLAGAMRDYGVGTLAEVYSAAAPFKPGGCMAQAWSVSEALRVWRLPADHS